MPQRGKSIEKRLQFYCVKIRKKYEMQFLAKKAKKPRSFADTCFLSSHQFFAPIFDNGLGLFPYAMKNDLENLAAYAKTRDAAFGVPFDEIAGAYITDRQRKQLRSILRFSFTKDRNYNLPAYRLHALEKFIRARAGELIEMS